MTAATPPPVPGAPSTGRVVVGVDGSEGSLGAVKWAVEEARARGCPVHAVIGWSYHPTWSYSTVGNMYPAPSAVLPSSWDPIMSDPPPPEHETEVDAEAAVRNAADATVTRVLEEDEEAGRTPVKVTTEAVEGHPAQVLLHAVTPADVLVVGSRGHGGVTGALLGSVTQHVVNHARCPVVVIPHGR